MGANSKIEWTDSTWSPIRARRVEYMREPNDGTAVKIGWHCEHVSEGCRNCYAESMNRRVGTGLDFKPGHRADIEIFLDEQMLLAPLRWKKPRHIFVNSMSDIFADFVTDEWLDRMFAVMALAPQHMFQVLTKRPERMRDAVGRIGRSIDILERHARSFGHTLKYVVQAEIAAAINRRPGEVIGLVPWPLPNVWLGTSAEDQPTADERIPVLLATLAAVRFVSLEPLLGPIDLGLEKWVGLFSGCFDDPPTPPIDWVIVGGESGKGARPMHPDWARSLRDQCAAAGVPFFFKQWGEWAPEDALSGLDNERLMNCRYGEFHGGTDWVDSCLCAEGDDGSELFRVGKRAAGRLLDGIEHNGMPT